MAKPIKHGHSWRIRWVNESGIRFSECYHTYRDAEYALKKIETEVEEIKKGIRSPTIVKKHFGELCESYLKFRSSRKRKSRDDESIIRVHLKPFFKECMLLNIEPKIKEFILSKNHVNKKTLHNILTLLISMLRYAHEEKWILNLPKIKKPRITLFNVDFHYLKDQTQITTFLASAKNEGDLPYYLYSMAIYTGMRAGELAALRWDNIDFNKRLITVSGSFGGETKNGEVRFIPILDVLLSILMEWRRINSQSIYVFPNECGNMQGESARIFKQIFHRVLDATEFPKVIRSGKLKRYIVFHDLRHTFASHWMMNNGNLFRLQKILGHKSSAMTQRYAHLEPSAFAEDYGRLGLVGVGENRLTAIK